MLSEQVKNELREVRYYFSRKTNMDALSKDAGVSISKVLADKYVNAIKSAPARLYDLFGCLYIQNKTQEVVASELCYSEEHIRRLIRDLINYFANKIN